LLTHFLLKFVRLRSSIIIIRIIYSNWWSRWSNRACCRDWHLFSQRCASWANRLLYDMGTTPLSYLWRTSVQISRRLLLHSCTGLRSLLFRSCP